MKDARAADGAARGPEARADEFDRLVYLLSHDLRACVRALIELPDWIERDLEEEGVELSASLLDMLALQKTYSRRLDQMIRDLLVHSRVGRMQEVTETGCDAALDLVLADLARPAGFRITRNIQVQGLSFGERDLRTLLHCLVSNAVKHHDRDDGGAHVSVLAEPGGVRIIVQDDGPGIEPQFHEHVFGVMTTLRPRDEVEGSGMGLAIAAKIAAHYGGGIRLISTPPERGARFEVWLPRRLH